MPNYLSPGVYMEEVDHGTKPIEAVGTAVAAFVGYTQRAVDERPLLDANGDTVIDESGQEVKERTNLLRKPTLVTNWSQYVAKFGGFTKGAYLPDAVYGYFANGGTKCFIVSVRTIGESEESEEATKAGVNVPSSEDGRRTALEFKALKAGSNGNSISVEIKPAGGESGAGTFNVVIRAEGGESEQYLNVTAAKGDNNIATKINQASKLVNVTISSTAKSLPAPAEGTYTLSGGDTKIKEISIADYQGSLAKREGIEGLEPFDGITMIAVPDLMSSYLSKEIDLKGVQAIQQMVITYCERVRYCFAILDAPPGMMPQEVRDWRKNQANYDSSRAALYYPWIEVADRTGSSQRPRMRKVPPCGHVAGIYARNDETRGVHKAPANEIVREAVGLEVLVTKGEQDLLNPDGVNCIRAFPGRGIRVWGARTLSSDPSWRYINVRRLFNMIEESIERGTQWVVFEPNDYDLWARVRRDVTAFLRPIWRTGALFGLTPEQAFYVKCDEETNPIELRDVGQLVVEVGLSPVKPAEFVIFRISQWAGPDSSS